MLLPYEALAVGALVKALEYGTLPIRRPTFTQPSLWSKALTKTFARPLPGNMPWTDVITVAPIVGYQAVIQSFVATTVVGQATSGVNFRLAVNGIPLQDVSIGIAIDLSKGTPTSYPCTFRPLFNFLTDKDTFSIQAENTSVLQRTVLAAVYGWYADALHNSSTFGPDTGIADSGVRRG